MRISVKGKLAESQLYQTRELPVFDITTESGEFVAGNIAVRNCDDFALLTAAMYGSLGHQSRVLIVDSQGNGLDHALASVETNIGFINADTTSMNPLGWVRNFGQTVVIE